MKNLSLSYLLIFLLIPGFFSCTTNTTVNADKGNDSLRGKITVSGAFALYPLCVKWAEVYQKLHPGVTINVSAGGAGKGMADALSKMVDLGMYSKEISVAEKAKGAWYLAVAKDAVLPTVNSSNPVLKNLQFKGMTKEQFYGIFITSKIKTWGMVTGTGIKAEIQAFTRSDACGAAEMWAKYLNNNKQEDLQGLGVNGDPGVADAVRRNINGIGYNNLNFVYDMETRKVYPGIQVIPIDLNNNGKVDPEENFYGSLDDVMKSIRDGIYPSPPARDLYLVSGGKPKSPVVVAFLHWILNDGQQYLNEAGYVVLTGEKISEGKEKLVKP